MKRKLHVGGGRSTVKIDLEILIVGGTSYFNSEANVISILTMFCFVDRHSNSLSFFHLIFPNHQKLRSRSNLILKIPIQKRDYSKTLQTQLRMLNVTSRKGSNRVRSLSTVQQGYKKFLSSSKSIDMNFNPLEAVGDGLCLLAGRKSSDCVRPSS